MGPFEGSLRVLGGHRSAFASVRATVPVDIPNRMPKMNLPPTDRQERRRKRHEGTGKGWERTVQFSTASCRAAAAHSK